MEKYKEDKVPITYIDEGGFAHDMPRTYGYSSIGERCFGTHVWNAKGDCSIIRSICNWMRNS